MRWALALLFSLVAAVAIACAVGTDARERHTQPPHRNVATPFEVSGLYGYGTAPTPAPTPTMSFSPTSLSLVLNGPLGTVTGTDLNYTGQVTATSGNTNIATVSPASAPAPGPMTFTITGIATGSTTVTITDGTRSVPVSVTVSSPTTYAQTVLNDSPCAFYRLADVPPSNPLFSSPMIDSSTNANNGTYAPGVMQAVGIVANDMSSTSMRVPGGTWFNTNQAYGPSNIAVQKPTTGVQFEIWASPETMQASVVGDRGGINGSGNSPTRVQNFTYTTGSTSGEGSSTVTLGTSGTAGQAPANGNHLVALVMTADNNAGGSVTAPAGWTSKATNQVGWQKQTVFDFTVSGTPPASVQFAYSQSEVATIYIVEVSQTSGVDVVTTSTATGQNSPWNTATGTGTQTGLNDLGIVFASIGDAILTGQALSGYTSMGTLGQHGDGGNSFGGTSAAYFTQMNITAASVPSQTVTWTNGDAGINVMGVQVLMAPSATQQPSPFRISMDSSFHAVFSVNIGGTASTVTSTTVMAYHTIYHIVGTYTGASQYITINNSKEGTTAKSGTISGYDTLSGIAIGGVYNNDNASLQWGGYIADVALYCNSTLMSDARITAHYTQGTGATAPTPTPAPTSTPTPGATCGPSPAPLTNGAEWNTSFTPYSCSSSPFNINIPASPQVATWSSAVINNQFANANSWPIRSQEAGTFDSGYSFWYADTTSPGMVQINLSCTAQASPNGGCNTVDNGGYPSKIWVPANFRMSPNSQQGDSIGVIIQCGTSITTCTHGTEIDVYSYNPGTAINSGTGPGGNWQTNDRLTVNVAAVNCGDWSAGSGFLTNFGATAGFNCAAGGMQHANEYIAGTINHSLKLILECQGQNGVNGVVYPVPASGATAHCGSQPNGGPPLGGLLWYDVPDSQTDANPNLKPWERAILKALHDHGGYFLDNSCPNGDAPGACTFATGIRQIFEGGAMFFYNGVTSPFAGLVPQGWVNSGIPPGEFDNRYTGADPWNPTGFTPAYWQAHFHYLDPCEAHNPRTC